MEFIYEKSWCVVTGEAHLYEGGKVKGQDCWPPHWLSTGLRRSSSTCLATSMVSSRSKSPSASSIESLLRQDTCQIKPQQTPSSSLASRYPSVGEGLPSVLHTIAHFCLSDVKRLACRIKRINGPRKRSFNKIWYLGVTWLKCCVICCVPLKEWLATEGGGVLGERSLFHVYDCHNNRSAVINNRARSCTKDALGAILGFGILLKDTLTCSATIWNRTNDLRGSGATKISPKINNGSNYLNNMGCAQQRYSSISLPSLELPSSELLLPRWPHCRHLHRWVYAVGVGVIDRCRGGMIHIGRVPTCWVWISCSKPAKRGKHGEGCQSAFCGHLSNKSR